MEMMCPHCGLTGKAESKLFGKKIRCPKCKNIFLVTSDVTVDDVAEASAAAEQEDQNPATIDLPGETITDNEIALENSESENQEAGPEKLPEGICICSKCGFRFSTDFIDESNDQPVCSGCA